MQAGKIKALAVTGRRRAPSAPDIPTVGRGRLSGTGNGKRRRQCSGRAACRWNCVNDRWRSLRRPRSRHSPRLEATGQIVDLRGPAEFAAGIEELRDKLAAIAKVLGIKPAQ